MLGGWERGLACCVRCLAVFWFPHRGSALETARGRLITTTTAAFRSKSTLLRGKPGSRAGLSFFVPAMRDKVCPYCLRAEVLIGCVICRSAHRTSTLEGVLPSDAIFELFKAALEVGQSGFHTD
jgi:hypothetical protein